MESSKTNITTSSNKDNGVTAKQRFTKQVRTHLRVNHYSRKTEEAYIGRTKRYILFHNNRHSIAHSSVHPVRYFVWITFIHTYYNHRKTSYVGYTNNLVKRIEEHNKGKVASTKNRVPLKLIYWEGCLNQQDARRREKYLKTSWGKRFIKNRLKNYLTG